MYSVNILKINSINLSVCLSVNKERGVLMEGIRHSQLIRQMLKEQFLT